MQLLILRSPNLDPWDQRPIWPAIEAGPNKRDHRDVYEAEIGIEPAGRPQPNGPHRKAADAVLCYRIFPPALVSGLLRQAPVAVGDTVGISYHILPGIDLFFAARVVACFDGQQGTRWCTGFTYQTLVGHPELGEETFSIEKSIDDGRVFAALRSWSRPGTLLAKIGAPVVRRLQVKASWAALHELRRAAAQED